MSEHHLNDDTMQALLAGTAAQANHLAEISESLLERVRMSKVERIYFIGMTLLILLVSVSLLYLGLSNRANTASTRNNTHLIIDCTSPNAGPDSCYARSQRATANAVAAIVQSQLVSSWCSGHSTTFSQAQKCVALLLKSH